MPTGHGRADSFAFAVNTVSWSRSVRFMAYESSSQFCLIFHGGVVPCWPGFLEEAGPRVVARMDAPEAGLNGVRGC
jgi:hypothetical protein